MFCPNGSLSGEWTDNWKTECFMDTIVAFLLTMFMTIFGVTHIKYICCYGNPTPPTLVPKSKLFYAQMTITLLFPVFEVAKFLVEILFFQNDVFVYQAIYSIAMLFVFGMSAKLIMLERYNYLPVPEYNGHSLTIKMFWILVFVSKNFLLIVVMEDNSWDPFQNTKTIFEFSIFVVSYILSIFLLIVCYKSPGLIYATNFSLYTFIDPRELYVIQWDKMKKNTKTLVTFIWPKMNFGILQRFIVCMLLMVAGRVANFYVPICCGKFVNSLTSAPYEMEWSQLFILIGGIVLQGYKIGFLETCRNALWMHVEEYTKKEFQVSLFQRLYKFGLRWHSEHPSSEVIKSISRETNAINILSSMLLFNVLPFVIDITVGVVFFFFYFNLLIGIVISILMFTYIVLTLALTEWSLVIQDRANSARQEMETRGVESLQKLETVKYFTLVDDEVGTYKSASVAYHTEELKMKVWLMSLNIIQNVIVCGGLLTLLYVFYINKFADLTIGDYALLAVYIVQLLKPLNYLSTFFSKMQAYWKEIDFVIELINTESDFEEREEILNTETGKIEFNNVNFSYGTESFLLKDISFSVGPGELLAVVGPPGAGKTTIAKLLFKMYPLYSGSIKINGHDISKVTSLSLRKTIGAVPQNVDLFDDTIEYNLRYGTHVAQGYNLIDPVITNELYEKGLKLPDQELSININEIPDEDLALTVLEKQQIAYNRVLMLEPPVTVFDEYIDKSEKWNEFLLGAYAKDRTVIYISRQLSHIVQNATKIIVVNQGEIFEVGKHEDLIMNKGLYSRMWLKQNSLNGLSNSRRVRTSSTIN